MFLFGHRDTPHSILPFIEKAIEEEIACGISVFYVGSRGNFDRLAATALRSVKRRHKNISLMLLLSYHPADRATETPLGFDGTFYPPLEGVPRRYAIIKANQYMVINSDSIICYVSHYGNTRELLDMAERKRIHQRIKNLAAKLS